MKRVLALIMFTALVAVSFTHNALAYDPFAKACNNGGGGSAVCSSNRAPGNPVSGPTGVLITVTHIVALAAGAAAIVIIIISGIRFITSQGEADKAARARKTLLNAAIGLVVIIFAQAIITYALGNLL